MRRKAEHTMRLHGRFPSFVRYPLYSCTMLRVFCEVPITSSTVRLGFVLVVTDDLYTFCSLHLSLIISPSFQLLTRSPAAAINMLPHNAHSSSHNCSQGTGQGCITARWVIRQLQTWVTQGVVLRSQRGFFRAKGRFFSEREWAVRPEPG